MGHQLPTPRHNFTELPRIRSERRAFELHYPHLIERYREEAHVGGKPAPSGVAMASPFLLVLDEATSALDTETERAVQRALDELSHGRDRRGARADDPDLDQPAGDVRDRLGRQRSPAGPRWRA